MRIGKREVEHIYYLPDNSPQKENDILHTIHHYLSLADSSRVLGCVMPCQLFQVPVLQDQWRDDTTDRVLPTWEHQPPALAQSYNSSKQADHSRKGTQERFRDNNLVTSSCPRIQRFSGKLPTPYSLWCSVPYPYPRNVDSYVSYPGFPSCVSVLEKYAVLHVIDQFKLKTSSKLCPLH